MKTYFSYGKLLITGEYLVLDGANALAVPTKYGQELNVTLLPGSGNIHWTAKDSDGNIWLNCSFILEEKHLISVAVGDYKSTEEIVVLKRILENALHLNPDFLNNDSDYEVITKLQFPNTWGLGSSSTLIANIAQWALVDSMALFFNSFEGSGYDVAVAMESKPILYSLQNKTPVWHSIGFNPSFSDQLYFIHLNKKQNSRDELTQYKKNAAPNPVLIDAINLITEGILQSTTLEQFEDLITRHEILISGSIGKTPVKQTLFNDYPGAIKSLGAWGGDFILATRDISVKYFGEKGYNTILAWQDIIKS